MRNFYRVTLVDPEIDDGVWICEDCLPLYYHYYEVIDSTNDPIELICDNCGYDVNEGDEFNDD